MVSLANAVTLSRIVGIPIFLILLESLLPRWISALAFSLLAATDLFDGRLARKNGITTTGAVLDPLADKLLVCSAFVFLIGKGVDAWMVLVIIAREFIVTAARALAPEIIHANKLAKWKTFVQMIAVIAVVLAVPYSWWGMLFATILTVVSGLQYLWVAREKIHI
ncbi:MAG TPA: CDP-diacylglycerol--glycerol-3-phosphate 3-phosphatidyltransferase [Candidatus Nanoarchaeia archaeon]|nr:CDP-diacylglycerol--glycerol-3-phosphate 3-phosphatidyltransferase [Candidatus Nanoarchaeia archaeon]